MDRHFSKQASGFKTDFHGDLTDWLKQTGGYLS